MDRGRSGCAQQGPHRCDLALDDDVETPVRADPDSALPVLDERLRRVPRQAVVPVEQGHAVPVESIDAGALRADPQDFFPILEHGTHRDAVLTARSGAMLESAVLVEADPAVRSDPQAAAAARRDGPG